MRPTRWIPALLTRTSTRPSSRVDRREGGRDARRVGDVGAHVADAVAGCRGAALSSATTRAPRLGKRRAIASPMPAARHTVTAWRLRSSMCVDILNRSGLRSEPIPEAINPSPRARSRAAPRARRRSSRGPTSSASASALGDSADQAISTVAKIEQSIESGQWEPAAQLVDYFMEEAKVVYVIYKVWIGGLRRLPARQGRDRRRVERGGRAARARCSRTRTARRSSRGRWDALGARGRRARQRAPRATTIDAPRTRSPQLDALREGWRQLHDRWRRLPGRAAHVRRAPLRRGRARGLLPARARAVPAGALQARSTSRERPYEETRLPQLVPLVRGDARPPLRPRAARRARRRGGRRPGRDRASTVRLGRPHAARRPVEGTRLARRGAVRVRRHAARSTTGPGTRRASATTAPTAASRSSLAGRALGPPGARRSTRRSTRDETSGPEPKKCTWTIYKTTRRDPGRGVRADRQDEAGMSWSVGAGSRAEGVVVTGAGGGIGRAVARAFADGGRAGLRGRRERGRARGARADAGRAGRTAPRRSTCATSPATSRSSAGRSTSSARSDVLANLRRSAHPPQRRRRGDRGGLGLPARRQPQGGLLPQPRGRADHARAGPRRADRSTSRRRAGGRAASAARSSTRRRRAGSSRCAAASRARTRRTGSPSTRSRRARSTRR